MSLRWLTGGRRRDTSTVSPESLRSASCATAKSLRRFEESVLCSGTSGPIISDVVIVAICQEKSS